MVGPDRMDYPGTMGAVRAVARYVGQILAESYVATDYAVLGVRAATRPRTIKAFRRLARGCRTSIPIRRRRSGCEGMNATYEVLSGPAEEAGLRPRRRPAVPSGGGGAGGSAQAGSGTSGHHGRLGTASAARIAIAYAAWPGRRRSGSRSSWTRRPSAPRRTSRSTRPSSAPPATVRARRRVPQPRPVTCVAGGVRCPRSRGPSSGRS